VDNLHDLMRAMDGIGYPAILKSRRLGYDGKGQVVLNNPADLNKAWEQMQGAPSIVEGFVSFRREVSIIGARRPGGEIAFYPMSENRHSGGILRVSECRPQDPLQREAEDYAARLMEGLNYVGVIALELFDRDGLLMANEFAPRVHNSGHWTIEGAETSQFENHLRAIADWPLGATKPRGYAGMVNFIGGLPSADEVLKIQNAHLHLYDKEPRKGRKVAHVTVRTDDPDSFAASLAALIRLARSVDDS
ncbi:MAG: 5-(carboxyamino)imidazole ribonucleotide synthase, partial [Gammaproteobacteria bacterium]